MILRSLAALVLPLIAAALAADDQRPLCSFEDDADLQRWEAHQGTARPSGEHATDGARSLEVAGNEYLTTGTLPGLAPGDWRGFDSLDIDLFNGGTTPVPVLL